MYSLLDGFSTPEDYLKRCSELGIKSFAVTEHGNVYSHVYFGKAKQKYKDMKILYGNEIYETEDMNVQDQDNRYYHLVVIAKNEKGRVALNKITTIANLEGFYYKPRISLDRLKPYADNLIVLSGCLASKIARESSYEKCIEYVNEYKSIFPHFYLEMQSHGTPDQEAHNKRILLISKATSTPIAITTDSHAATKEELVHQGYHVQIAQDKETMGETYSGCYVQSVQEIHEIMDKQIGFENVEIGLENTNKIADLCDVVNPPFQEPTLPHFTLPDGYESNIDYLRYLCNIGWASRGIYDMTDEQINIRKERLEYELSVIEETDYSGYFLILWDALNWARQNDIYIGDGRGSAAGSLVCYLLHITNLDPIKYELLFERFLNPERVGMPDIDVDVEDRESIINYLMSKYGEDKVCQVMNFSYITPVVAIKDVASKILNIPYAIAEQISKRFAYSTFDECIENDPTIYDDYPEYRELFEIAKHISGKIRHTSTHAGGVGIVSKDLANYSAIKLGSKNEHVIQVDKKMVEEIGIVKYDLLGVTTLNIVKDTIREANIDPWEIDINNPEFENNKASFDLICSGNTDLVFQMESSGMKELAKRVQPRNIDELSAVIALYRPDSMPFIDDYINGKRDYATIKHIHPDMEPILRQTHGSLIYQEQIMEIVRKFGGRTYGGSDTFRKLIGKKLKELVKPETDKLRQEIIDNGYSVKIAEELSEMLSVMGGYSFNKSHSISYASLALKTAYLKVHYPKEFYKASFNIIDKSQLSRFIVDANNNGIKVYPPSINKSESGFSIQDGKLMFGLSSIKGLGDAVSFVIEERNKNGNFKGFKDFIDRCNPGESLIVSLIKSGALPCKNKKEFLLKYAESKYTFNYKPVVTLPTLKELESTWGIDTKEYDTKESRLEIYNQRKEIVDREKFEKKKEKGIKAFVEKYMQDEDLWEFETLSTFITNNPFEKIYKEIRPFDEVEEGMSGVVVGVISKITKKKDRNKNQFAYVEIYSAFGIEEVTVWASQYKVYHTLIKKGNKISALCKKKEGKGFVSEIKTYDEWEKDREKIINK